MTRTRDQFYIEVWNDILQYLRSSTNVTSPMIDTFYEPSSIYELNQEKVIIIVGSIITKEVMRSQLDILSNAFIDVLNLDHPLIVEICLSSELPKLSEIDNAVKKYTENDFMSMPVQKDRTFENFVVGDCNKESQAAALACALNPGGFFNPLFIYGNSGLGKTHLLMAIANEVKRTDPNKKIYYTESLKFVETVVKAIQEGKIEDFKHYMYSLDLFLVDDIQFLAGKEKSHEIFFTIYNELVNNGKQVCIASDRQPREIKGLEERLISRFSSGLSVGIDSPEFETSLAILQKKIESNGYGIDDIDEQGLSYIASNFSGNVRELEGAWNRVLFYAIEFQPDGGIIRFETVMNALKNQVVVSDKNGMSPRSIIKAVAEYYGLTKQQITSKTRTKNIANARHISIYLCRKMLDMPYIKIGEEFGGRDHSTIISACLKVEKQLKTDPVFKTAVSDIEKLIGV